MFLLLGRDFEHLLGQIVSIGVKSLCSSRKYLLRPPPPTEVTEIPKGTGEGAKGGNFRALLSGRLEQASYLSLAFYTIYCGIQCNVSMFL